MFTMHYFAIFALYGFVSGERANPEQDCWYDLNETQMNSDKTQQTISNFCGDENNTDCNATSSCFQVDGRFCANDIADMRQTIDEINLTQYNLTNLRAEQQLIPSDMLTLYYRTPLLCNECNIKFNEQDDSDNPKFNLFCTSNPDPEEDCYIRAQKNIANNKVSEFCVQKPECNSTALCFFVDGQECYPEIYTNLQLLEDLDSDNCLPDPDIFLLNIEKLCTPCIKALLNSTKSLDDECGASSDYDLCLKNKEGDRCAPKLFKMLSLLEQYPDQLAVLYLNPDICNECTMLYSSSFSKDNKTRYDQICPVNPDYESICYVKAGVNIQNDTVSDFCDAHPYCKNTSLCYFPNGTKCYLPFMDVYNKGYDLNNIATLSDDAFTMVCTSESPCFEGFMGEDFAYFCAKVKDIWCAPKGVAADQEFAKTAGMKNTAIAAQYMHDPIFCNDCMAFYSNSSAANATQTALYGLVCPSTASPTGPPTSPPTESSSTSVKLSGFLSIVYALRMFL